MTPSDAAAQAVALGLMFAAVYLLRAGWQWLTKRPR
jgi:hypothetical protein